MTARPLPLPPVRWTQSCPNSECHRKGQVQAETPTGTALRCASCEMPMNVVRIASTLPPAQVAAAKVCKFCRDRLAASDLGCCDKCYIARHRDYEQSSWEDERDEVWAAQQFRRDVGGGVA